MKKQLVIIDVQGHFLAHLDKNESSDYIDKLTTKIRQEHNELLGITIVADMHQYETGDNVNGFEELNDLTNGLISDYEHYQATHEIISKLEGIKEENFQEYEDEYTEELENYMNNNYIYEFDELVTKYLIPIDLAKTIIILKYKLGIKFNVIEKEYGYNRDIIDFQNAEFFQHYLAISKELLKHDIEIYDSEDFVDFITKTSPISKQIVEEILEDYSEYDDYEDVYINIFADTANFNDYESTKYSDLDHIDNIEVLGGESNACFFEECSSLIYQQPNKKLLFDSNLIYGEEYAFATENKLEEVQEFLLKNSKIKQIITKQKSQGHKK